MSPDRKTTAPLAVLLHAALLELQNHPGQMQQLYEESLADGFTLCWAFSTVLSCQPAAHSSFGTYFYGVHIYMILKLLCFSRVSVPSLLQCSSTCGKGLQSRVVQCMHKVTGRHGSECPILSKPAAYRQCHQEVCNEKINVNTITSPRLGEWGVLGWRTRQKAQGPTMPGVKSNNKKEKWGFRGLPGARILKKATQPDPQLVWLGPLLSIN